MGEYLMGVIGAALFGGVITSALPDTGGGGSLKKYMGFIASLCVLCVILSPVTDALDTLSDFFDGGLFDWVEKSTVEYENEYYEYLVSYGKENAEEGISALICKEFSIDAENCHVSAEVYEDEGALYLKRIRVILSGRAILKNPYEIEEYLSEIFGCECIVGG